MESVFSTEPYEWFVHVAVDSYQFRDEAMEVTLRSKRPVSNHIDATPHRHFASVDQLLLFIICLT
jgi:hypothetical protein